MKTTKIISLLLAVLMLGCMVGCGEKKSMEMTLNDGILENDYFSLDASAYDVFRIGAEETGSESILAYAVLNTGNGPWKEFFRVDGIKRNNPLPNKAYFEAAFKTSWEEWIDVASSELLEYETFSTDSANGLRASALQILTDGSHAYITMIMLVTNDKMTFTIYFYDYDMDTELDDIYTNAVNSFTLK